MASQPKLTASEAKRVGKFGLVGVLNTLIDFAIFNLLGHFGHLNVVAANLISTTIAMAFSFVANKQMVFQRQSGSLVTQAVTFYVATAFGLYVLQTGAIHILTSVWTYPTHIAVDISHILGLGQYLHDEFVIKNTAKAIGTLLSLTWNYIIYKKVVFR